MGSGSTLSLGGGFLAPRLGEARGNPAGRNDVASTSERVGRLGASCEGMSRLHRGEGRVSASGQDEFLVGALLEDATSLEVENQVGAGGEAEVVSDPECGAPAGQPHQGVDDPPFVFLVEAGGGLIEDQDGGLADGGAGDAIRCRCPPESVTPRSPTRVS